MREIFFFKSMSCVLNRCSTAANKINSVIIAFLPGTFRRVDQRTH